MGLDQGTLKGPNLSLVVCKVCLDHHECCQSAEQAHYHGPRRVPLVVLHHGGHQNCSRLEPYGPPRKLQTKDLFRAEQHCVTTARLSLTAVAE